MKEMDYFNGTAVRQVVNTRKLNFGEKIRTVTISDLHNYINDGKRALRLAEAIKREEPDIIFIAGDIFNSSKSWNGGEKLYDFRHFVDILSEAAPVCITLGNHDLIGLKWENDTRRIGNFHRLADIRSNKVFPLYNDRVIINGMEIIGFVPPLELMYGKGLQTQIHGIAHDQFIELYHKNGVKFSNDPKTIKAFLGHDPHLIASSENGVGLGDLVVCDFTITGHLHGGYKKFFDKLTKMKKFLTGKETYTFDLDKGLTEQPTGIVDKDGNYIKGSRSILGPTNLCRGIVYFDDDAQQKILQLPNGNFYRNVASKPNEQNWIIIFEQTARKYIMENNLHFMLISEGINPNFVLKKEKNATYNVVDLVSDEHFKLK